MERFDLALDTVNFVPGISWFDSLLPCGVPVPSSIVISGPSGTGKPFVGLALAGAWLRQGGRVIFVPIHPAYPALFERGLQRLYGFSLRDYTENHFFLLLDPDLDPREESVEVEGGNAIRCNLLNHRVGAGGGSPSRRILIPKVGKV